MPHPHSVLTLCLAGFFALGLTGCADEKDQMQGPTLEPLAAAVSTTVPLAYAVAVAQAAISGNAVNGVTTSTVCNTYPCLASATFNLADGSIPATLQSYGDVYVAGLWQSAEQALVTVVFLGSTAGSRSYPVNKISTIPVMRTAAGLTLVYASTDINIATDPDDSVSLSSAQQQAEADRLSLDPGNDLELAAALDAWVVNVDFNHTPLDFGDDSYTLSGGAQFLGVGDQQAYVYQLGALGMTMNAGCVLNPRQGYALINELEVSTGAPADWPRLGTASLEFHPTCDGKARALLAVGSYGALANKIINLNFAHATTGGGDVPQSTPGQQSPQRPPAPPRDPW